MKKTGLKLSIQKTKIKASSPITSWQIDEETVETVTDFIFLGSKITADGDCRHEIKKRLLLGRKVMTNLDSILKSRDITLPIKVCLVKTMACFDWWSYGIYNGGPREIKHGLQPTPPPSPMSPAGRALLGYSIPSRSLVCWPSGDSHSQVTEEMVLATLPTPYRIPGGGGQVCPLCPGQHQAPSGASVDELSESVSSTPPVFLC